MPRSVSRKRQPKRRRFNQFSRSLLRDETMRYVLVLAALVTIAMIYYYYKKRPYQYKYYGTGGEQLDPDDEAYALFKAREGGYSVFQRRRS